MIPPALTLRPPWSSFVFLHNTSDGRPGDWPLKDVENRTWAPPGNYRGPLLIHAGQRYETRTSVRPCARVERHARASHGMILGIVDLVDVVTDSDSPWAMPGHFHWILREPRRFRTAIPALGRRRMWHPSVDLSSGFIIGDPQ